MTNSLSPQALKTMNTILKPYEKNCSDHFAKLLTQVPSEKEQFFLCLLSIMLGSPNCINHSLFYISSKIYNKIENNSNQISNSKSKKSKQGLSTEPNSQQYSDLIIFTPKDIPNSLSPEIITNFWISLSYFYRSKKEASNLHIHLASLVDLIPSFYDEKILDSLLTPKNNSFLVINYIQKVKNNNLFELSERIIENCSIDQIKLFIPFIVSFESSSKIIENWITNHIYNEEEHENNFKYEIALTAALSSYQCVSLLPTTIDLILINFLNSKFSIDSEIFESFLFYFQRHYQLFDRDKHATKEDFLISFFSSFIRIRPSLFKESIVCPNMFTKMIHNKIRIPPFSLTLFFNHLDDFLLKYIARQFIVNDSYINYIKRCYEKSTKVRQNSYSRKVLDYSIMALFLKTIDINSIKYPIVIEMIGKIKMPREEFANFVFMQIAKMFANRAQRSDALHIIENWKKDDLSKITKLLLVVFNTKNINALVNVEEIICKRGGHALTALFNLASTTDFCADKARRTLLITVIQRLVSQINVSRLKPRNYMQTQLFEFIESNMNSKQLQKVDLNSSAELKQKSTRSNLQEENDPDKASKSKSKHKSTSISPPSSPLKSKLRPKMHSNEKTEIDSEKDASEHISPLRSKTKSRTVSTLNPELKYLPQPPSSLKSKSRIRTRNSIENENEAKIIINDENECKLTNDQLEKFLISQISNKSANKIETSKIVRKIIQRIGSLDRKHSKHHHTNSNKSNSGSHRHSKEKHEKEITKEKSEIEEDENKNIEKIELNNETSKKVENENENKSLEKNESNKIDETNENNKEGQNQSHQQEEEEDINDDQIQLNEEEKENQSSGLYNVVGSVMKMLFSFRSSLMNNSNEVNKNKPNYRSSLPIHATKADENINNTTIDKKEEERKNSVQKPSLLSAFKTEPIFEEKIDISSDEGMAFPDDDYSSSSNSDYSDIDISSFDFEISDNEVPIL